MPTKATPRWGQLAYGLDKKIWKGVNIKAYIRNLRSKEGNVEFGSVLLPVFKGFKEGSLAGISSCLALTQKPRGFIEASLGPEEKAQRDWKL